MKKVTVAGMMETPFGPLESLVGRTFEKGGRTSTVKGVSGKKRITVRVSDRGEAMDHFWYGDAFIAWLSGAKEVAP